MAQGKLKLKSQVPTAKAKKSRGGGGTMKKGRVTKKVAVMPKGRKEQGLAKFKKDIRKNINNSIEAELSYKAKKAEEGRGFHCGDIGAGGSKSQA